MSKYPHQKSHTSHIPFQKNFTASFLLIFFLISLSISPITPKTFAQTQQTQQSSTDGYFDLLVRMLCIFLPCSGDSTSGGGQNPFITPGPGQPQPTVVLPTGEPATGEQLEIADSARRLVDIIQTNCGGIATIANSCYNKIKDIDFVRQTAAGSELQASIYYAGPGRLQCVGFAKASSAGSGIKWNQSYGTARNYLPPKIPPSGFRFISKGSAGLSVGDIPIWDHDPAGHMAVVVEVYDENNFRVAEANWKNEGDVQLHPKQVNGPTDRFAINLRGWYRKI